MIGNFKKRLEPSIFADGFFVSAENWQFSIFLNFSLFCKEELSGKLAMEADRQ